MNHIMKYLIITALSVVVACVVVQSSPVPGYLGVLYERPSAEKAKELKIEPGTGVLLTRVVKDSPADKAGLKAGDVIIEIDGKRIEKSDDFSDLIEQTEAGEEVLFKVLRNGNELSIKAKLGEHEDFSEFYVPEPPDVSKLEFYMPPRSMWIDEKDLSSYSFSALSGMLLVPLNEDLAKYFNLKEGMLVAYLIKDGDAEREGVKAGDVITAINDLKVKSIEDVDKAFSGIKDDKKLRLDIIRQSKKQTINLAYKKDHITIFLMPGLGSNGIKVIATREAEKKAQKVMTDAFKKAIEAQEIEKKKIIKSGKFSDEYLIKMKVSQKDSEEIQKKIQYELNKGNIKILKDISKDSIIVTSKHLKELDKTIEILKKQIAELQAKMAEIEKGKKEKNKEEKDKEDKDQ